MKYLLSICLIIYFLNPATAQENEKEFLRQVVHPSKPIIYTDKLKSSEVSQLKRELERDSLGYSIYRKSTGIVLTPEERDKINAELLKMENPIWSNGVIPNSRMLSHEIIDQIFKYNEDGWARFYQHYDSSGYYSFSRPIFLRDTICIFYIEHKCGYMCGQGSLTVYKRTTGIWKSWLELFNWIS